MTSPSTPPSDVARSPWLVVALGFGAIVFEGYDLIVYGSAVPALLAHPGWALTPAQAGVIGSLALLGMVIGAPAAGWLTDRFGRRRLFIGLLAYFSAMMILVALAPSPELLGLFRFLAGVGFGGIPPTAIALVIEIAPAARRLLFNAIMLSGFGFGGIFAAIISIAFLVDVGFRGLFAVGALPLVTLVPLAAWLLPESPNFRTGVSARKRGVRNGPGSILRGRAAIATTLFAVANFCGFMVVFGLNTWLPQLMRGAGYQLGSALAFLLVLNIGAVLGGISASALSDRYGGRIVATTMFLIATVTLALLAVPSSSVVLTFALVFVAGATAVGSQAVLWGYVATHYRASARATALGVTSGIGRLGAAAGPLVGGVLVGAGVGLAGNVAVFAAAAVVGALAAVFVPTLMDGSDEEPATEKAVLAKDAPAV